MPVNNYWLILELGVAMVNKQYVCLGDLNKPVNGTFVPQCDCLEVITSD